MRPCWGQGAARSSSPGKGGAQHEGVWMGECVPWTLGEGQAPRVVLPSHDSQRE